MDSASGRAWFDESRGYDSYAVGHFEVAQCLFAGVMQAREKESTAVEIAVMVGKTEADSRFF